MEHNMLTLDFWRDTVTYEGTTIIGTEIYLLDIIQKMYYFYSIY